MTYLTRQAYRLVMKLDEELEAVEENSIVFLGNRRVHDVVELDTKIRRIMYMAEIRFIRRGKLAA